MSEDFHLKHALDVAGRLAQEAGEVVLLEQRDFQVLSYKDRQDVVTSADLKAEEIILNGLKREFPDHNILSEEEGEERNNSEFRWVIDPLDGTKEYVRGLPGVAVALALEFRGEPILGVVNVVRESQLFRAAKGLGASLNGKPVGPSKKTNLSDAFIYCYLPTYKISRKEFAKAWSQLGRVARVSYRLRGTSNCNLGSSWVAAGAGEAFVLLGDVLKRWDLAPGLAIAQEAGAKITNSLGQPLKAGDTSKGVVVSNGLIHDKLISLINKR